MSTDNLRLIAEELDCDIVLDEILVAIGNLKTRQQELLQTIVRLTHETPFPDEIVGWQDQRAKLVAEVGRLRAALMDVRRQLLDRRVPGGPQGLDRLLVANILAGIELALERKP